MKKDKKPWIAAATLTLAAAMTMGTFAWQSISQEALNEKRLEFQAGGRLHDDFNGTKKSVYVENYMDPKDEKSAPIFVRIRLHEYMETGSDAGTNRELLNEARGDVKPVQVGAEINDPATWQIHKPGDLSDPFHTFWTLGTGGATSYMPTFNKDNTSLEPDVNGTYEGTAEGDTVHFDDFIDYTLPATEQTKTADADYGVGHQVSETHTVTTTPNAEVITMDEWQTIKNRQPGKYWVWDSDGWAYWAEALQPGEATGLLINSVKLKTSNKCYYAIHVVNQQASAKDWGEKGAENNGMGTGATGFYIDGMTDDALELLNIINVVPDEPETDE